MKNFLMIFMPAAIFATGVLWLLVRSMGFDQEAPNELVKAFQIAPFLLGPALSAQLTLMLLRLTAKVDHQSNGQS